MRSAVAALLALTAAWPSSSRGDGSTDRLIVAADYQQLADSAGHSLGVDFVRSSADRTLSVGAGTVSVADSRWSIVRGSAYRKLRGGVDVLGLAEAGPGSNGGDSFTYERLQAGATVPVTSSWRIVARDTFVDVEPIRGHVLTAGANFRRRAATTQFELSRAVGGNIEQRSIGFRIDTRVRKSAVFAGALIGDSNNRLLLNEPSAALANTRIRQAYAGITRTLRRIDLTMTADLASIGATHRQSVGAVVGIPLAPR